MNFSEVKEITIPEGNVKKITVGGVDVWTKEDVIPSLCFTAEETASTVKLTKVGSPTEWQLYVSTDGSNFTAYTLDTEITLANIGDKVYFKGDSENAVAQTTSKYHKFVMSGKISASGSIMSLIGNNETITAKYQFGNLFNNCASLISADIILPATVYDQCYYQMFYNCTSLIAPPSLPATTMAAACYYGMFNRCSSLIYVPKLPARILYTNCYAYMFNGCSALSVYSNTGPDHSKAWHLPSETERFISSHSFTNIFYGVKTDNVPSTPTFENRLTYYTKYEPI